MKRAALGASLLIVFLAGSVGGGVVGATLVMKRGQSFGSMVQNVTKNDDQKPIIPAESANIVARAEEAATISVVKAAAPAVVSITISREVSQIQQQNPFNDFNNFFSFNFPNMIPQAPAPAPAQPEQKTKQKVGGGSGFIVSEDGVIVTNKHVAADDISTYTVTTSDGKEFEAKVLARDPVVDVAILKIEAKGLPTLSFGDSDKIQIGETTIAIGNALAELQNTVTKGVVSALNRRVQAGSNDGMSEVIEEAIQTDAAINPGNSGGPLLDLDGKVIGMNTAIDQGGQSLGFSIPSNIIARIVTSVEKNGRIVRSWLGVRYVLLEQKPDVAKALGYEHGALILSGGAGEVAIVKDSPAEKAGLKERDLITKVNATEVNQDHSLSIILSKFSPGDVVSLTVIRQGKEMAIPVTLAEFDEKALQAGKKK